MGSLAGMLVAAGHQVTGSDEAIYPPMSDELKRLEIRVFEGYRPENLAARPDVIVIGNAISRGNPEVEYVLNEGLYYTSMPAVIQEEFLRKRHSIVVAGTHGKTTTSSMLAWILEAAGLEPGFLIGGVPSDFGTSARQGTGRHFVIEADEYDTAFFDKRSKMVHYQPKVAVLNNIEFDHADIFPDLASIETQFHYFVRTVPGEGRLVVNGADPAVQRVLARGCWTPVERFGVSDG